eukprot:Partr_v1_DN26724_c0_g1_i1_m8625 putative cell division cycle 45 homolog (S. cerevisiae)
MHLKRSNYHIAYSHLKKLASSTTPTIFVNQPDVDALCAAKILTAMFISDLIEFKMIPIQGFTDLSRECANVESQCLIFINCGGLVDLSQVISAADVTVFVIDSHRPLNLDNLFCGVDRNGDVVAYVGAQIVVFDDGDCEELDEERAAYFALLDDDDDDDLSGAEEEEDEVSSASDNEDATDGTRRNARKLRIDDDDDDNSDVERELETVDKVGSSDEEDEDKENVSSGSRKRSRSLSKSPVKVATRTSKSGRMLASEKKMCENLLKEYNRSTYYATPASALVYSLSSQLSKESNDFLWNAIIGLSSQFITGRQDMEQYLFHVELFKDETRRFNPNVSTEPLDGGAITATSADDYSIHFNSSELRLMLYRHWSLYDAMYHSSYVAAKLGIWRERGRQKLRNLLAKMGFSIVQSQQNYYDCDLDLRKVMESRLEDAGVMFGLDALNFESFVRCFGFKTVIGACDAVYALDSLLEISPAIAHLFHFDDNAEPNGFYMAFDALDRIESLRKGIEMAQVLQRAIVKTGTQLIEERMVKTLKTFRLVVLKESADMQLFCHSLTLLKLALFMTEAMKQTGKSDNPFVIAALDKEHELYLVVGLCSGRSSFSQAFRKCADVTQAKIRQDRFDCSVIEIGKTDLAKFMEHLQIFL